MVWPRKEANAFTLGKSQNDELESDLKQDDFLKIHEKHPSYKAAFDFRTNMYAQL